MKTHTRLALIGLFLTLFSCSAFADEYQEAYENTQAEFQATVDTVSQTKEKVDEIKDKLETMEKFIRDNPKLVKNKGKILRKIKETKKGLAKYSGHLGKFGDYAGKVTDAFATANELADIRNQAKSHKGGKLAENMHYIGTAMEKFGDKVPILGPAVAAYGQMTTGILTATDKVAGSIDKNRNMGMIGAGTYGGMDNPKYQKMVEQFGRDFADSNTYAPSDSSFIYRPIDNPTSSALIWDDKSQEWYKADGNVPVEQIYKDNLVAGKRRDPWQLNVLSNKYDSAKDRKKEAEKIYDHLKRTWSLPYGMYDKDEFIAKYTYDGDANKEVKNHLADLKEKYGEKGDKRREKGIDKLVKKTKIKIPEREKPEAPEEDEPAGQDGTADGDQDGSADGDKQGNEGKDADADKDDQDTDDAAGDADADKDDSDKSDDDADKDADADKDDQDTDDAAGDADADKDDSDKSDDDADKDADADKDDQDTDDAAGDADADKDDSDKSDDDADKDADADKDDQDADDTDDDADADKDDTDKDDAGDTDDADAEPGKVGADRDVDPAVSDDVSDGLGVTPPPPPPVKMITRRTTVCGSLWSWEEPDPDQFASNDDAFSKADNIKNRGTRAAAAAPDVKGMGGGGMSTPADKPKCEGHSG